MVVKSRMEHQNFDNLNKGKFMNIRILTFLMILSVAGLGAAPNKVLTMEEKEELKQIETVRKSGFTDIEIDNLHASIAGNILKINGLLGNETYKKALRYIEDEPRVASKFLFQDKENKQYLELDLGLGQSFADYPKTYLYQSRIYIYPGTDGQSLEKIILQFKRTNAKGEVFIREMRRLVNNSPKGPTFLGDGKELRTITVKFFWNSFRVMTPIFFGRIIRFNPFPRAFPPSCTMRPIRFRIINKNRSFFSTKFT